MSAVKQNNLYESVVEIATDYLGPTARRFIDRQIESHSNKQPANLSAKDLEQLIDWIKVSLALLTEDTSLIKEFTSRLIALTHVKSNSA